MRFQRLNDEVLVATEPLVWIGEEEIAELKTLAAANLRRRIRICAHSEPKDRLHEMLIVHVEGAYIRPHKHLGKSESVHVIEGEADAVFFDDAGTPEKVLALGPYGSARRLYYRLDEPVYHTLLVNSEFFVMHEVTNGPFWREETVFAPWAPAEADGQACERFRLELSRLARGARR